MQCLQAGIHDGQREASQLRKLEAGWQKREGMMGVLHTPVTLHMFIYPLFLSYTCDVSDVHYQLFLSFSICTLWWQKPAHAGRSAHQ